MVTAKKKILIVEDEKPMSRALELKLTHSDYSATVAYNGEEALKLLEKNKFNLILLDLILPKMDGFTFLKTLQDKKIKTPVIVLSNLSQGEDAKKAQALGAKGYFIKSNTPIAQLVESVKMLI